MLDLSLPPADLAAFVPLLQRGVELQARAGASVASFLVDELGVDPEYVRQRVTTVFLDGSVVDDLEQAHLRQGSLLALSAAMPGLVGATLRKGGYYGAMRASITRAPDAAAPAPAQGVVRVRVKLFNLLIEELGPVLLAAGVLVPAAEAVEVLGARAPALPPGGGEVGLRVRFG